MADNLSATPSQGEAIGADVADLERVARILAECAVTKSPERHGFTRSEHYTVEAVSAIVERTWQSYLPEARALSTARETASGGEVRDAALREAAAVAYRTCAETRHVFLGYRCSDAILALQSAEPPAKGGS